jgi:hypothetical protein
MKGETNFFWINKKGLPLSADTCREYIKFVIYQITEKKLNIRLLRLNINSHYFDTGPHQPQEQAFWNYMMDHTPETEQDYYRLWETEAWSHQATVNSHPFLVCIYLFILYLYF